MQTLNKLLLIILLFLGLQNLEAQNESLIYKDLIFLNHGSKIVGAITEYHPDDSVTMKLKNGNELTFYANQIKRIVMHEEKERSVSRAVIPMKTQRFFHEAQVGLLSNNNGNGVTLSYNLLYQKNAMVAFGGGFGMDNYYAAPGREIFPIFANAKINLTSGNNVPYVGMKMGYGMAFKREEYNITQADGGLMTNPYVGLRLGSRGLMVNLFAGLRFQKVDYILSNSWETRREDILHRRLEFGMALML
ncbi:hypothetical protein [Portibacter marinus]|uniref:hypothetical protein n=1 Tax=Portibacter marinus TaxID=2898660 RepID=UPI001F2D1E37|nr:hypothetical protein [Portibacter marinus]